MKKKALNSEKSLMRAYHSKQKKPGEAFFVWTETIQ